ncbi:MAG: glycoside hydrolase family 2 TIM barrel-domain containing protein [Opitutales bacterium]
MLKSPLSFRRLFGFLLIVCWPLLASAAVVVDQAFVPDDGMLATRTSSYLLEGGAGGALAGFAPGNSDKLVVAFSSESGGPVAVTSVTYGGRALRPAVRANSPGDRHHAAIFYLDNPPASGDLRIDFDGGRFGVGVSLLALSGTEDGFGATAATAGGENEISLTTTTADSLVLFANIFNGGSGSSAPAPLQPLVDAEVGSASHGAGYQLVATPGEVSARFEDGSSGDGTVTLAVCFPSGSTVRPPADNPIRQSHDWGQVLDGFHDHDYLSEVGAASTGPSSPTDTWRQYLSGTDKDHTVDWDFYVTKWGKVQEWRRLPVPSCWEMHGFGRLTYYDEDSGEKGSYNYKFRVPEAWQGQRRVEIVFEGVALETYVYVNGQPLAAEPHAGGFYRFSYDITDQLDYDGVNLLEVHVDNDSPNHPGLVAAEGGDYWRYGGIFRPVYLEAKPTAHIDHCAIDARADGSLRAEVSVEGLSAPGRLMAVVTGVDGKPIGELMTADLALGQEKAELKGQFQDPLLWSAEFPNLYHLELRLAVAGHTTHTTRERFGFRTVEVRPGEGLFVNGAKVIIRGVNRHTMWPDSGKTVSEEVDRLDIERIKEMNMNAVRAGHYPPDRSFIELCDELGLYVLEELASCQNLLPTKTGIPLVRSMIRRDVNSPSVIFWANGNEGGHNSELDPYFKEADIQKRPVIYSRHGRDPVDGIITDHYEPYKGIQEIIEEEKIYIATELAHGLYDGGAGAGLEDRWELMMNAPLTQGIMIWTLLDEGIRRYYLDGRLDTSGNQAPDGLVGPYREREGSFYTVRELFSPIHVGMRELPEDFNGRIEIENRYNFTNANQCTFRWELVSFRGPKHPKPGHTVDHRGAVTAPSIPPGTNPDFHSGWLDLGLPLDWKNSDALRLTATDPHGNDLCTWTWVTGTAAERRAAIVQPEAGQVKAREASGKLVLAAGGVEATFDTKDGRLVGIAKDGEKISFGNGPVLVTGKQKFEKIRHYAAGDRHVVEVTYRGNMKSAKWTMNASGWLKLDYHYHLTGEVPFMGISFDYPESKVNSMTWLGRGPFRVWKNRLIGPTWDVWKKDYNQTATGYPESIDPYDYPEFKGYHADVRWVVLHTDEGDLTFVAEDEELFFRNFSADYAKNNRGVDPAFPKGDLSFLDGIAPQSNKISHVTAPLMGPQGEPNYPTGDYRRTLYFRF